jgi:hypothetical protein
MRLVQKRSVVFAGVMGLATGVLTGNSGLSPIIPIIPYYYDIVSFWREKREAANEAMLLAA